MVRSVWKLVAGFALAAALTLPIAGTAQQPPPADDSAKAQADRQATQPLNNAPVWREVRSGDPAYTSIKGQETNVLIQPNMRLPGQPSLTAGEAWRQFRNNVVTPLGGWGVLGVVIVVAAFFWWKGSAKLHSPSTGRLIERFNALERYTHWVLAITFCILGVTGLIILVGKYVLLPIFGYTLFAWLTGFSKNVHNFVGPIFALSLIVFIVLFIKDNLPRKYDFAWFKSAGGMFGGKHVASHKFNAGEKVWFWVGVVVLSTLVSASGFILNFPNFDQTRSVMIQANLVHAIGAIGVILLSLGHMFMGTIGVDGAYKSMRFGYVDETWAKEHHQYWYDDVKAGKIKAPKAQGVPEHAQVQH
jgi:formate dehydrogenase subunit gamma